MFSQAYIIGGSPCSGKSSIAERLSATFDFQYYKVDDFEQEHAKRYRAAQHPTMHKLTNMRWDEIWMRPISVQVEEEFAYYRERFEMIREDLEHYHREQPIVLEGAAFSPELLEANDVNQNRVIFLVPTLEFQLLHYSRRAWIKDILQECNAPEQAFENWMMRDHLFGQTVLQQAQARGFRCVIVDGQRDIDQQFEIVAEFFGLRSV